MDYSFIVQFKDRALATSALIATFLVAILVVTATPPVKAQDGTEPCELHAPRDDVLEILAVGDSLTQGASNMEQILLQTVPPFEHRVRLTYRYHLWKKLRDDAGLNVEFVGTRLDGKSAGENAEEWQDLGWKFEGWECHEGYSAHTASNVDTRIALVEKLKKLPAFPQADVVLLMAGTNDANNPSISMEQVGDGLEELIAEVKRANPEIILIAKIPPCKGSACDQRVDPINKKIEEAANADPLVQWVDQHTAFEDKIDDLLYDWAHPKASVDPNQWLFLPEEPDEADNVWGEPGNPRSPPDGEDPELWQWGDELLADGWFEAIVEVFSLNVNAYFPELTPGHKDVETKPEAGAVCADGFSAGTVTIRARFENTSTDTTLSTLAFRVKENSDGSIICNADGRPGGEGATIEVAREDDYADGLLGPGEHFYQTFKVGLDDWAPFTLFVDLLGSIALDETAPSLIQSTFVPGGNNLEVVVRETDNKLHQYFGKADANGDIIWQPGSETFAEGATSAPSMIQSTLGPEGNNLEVVVRGADRQLHQYFREKDQSDKFVWIEGSESFAPKSTSAASLIQSTFGPEGNKNLEVVVREDDNMLHHYFRKRDERGVFVWKSGGEPFASDVTSAPALIQSNLGPKQDNFEVVVRQGDKLYHWFRERVDVDEDVFEWRFGDVLPAENVTSAPSLIQSTFGPDGNLQVVVRQADNKLHHYYRERVSVDPDIYQWRVGGVLPAENVMSGPSFIQSTLGPTQDNLELVVRESGKVRHYVGERVRVDPDVFEWKFGGDVTQ